MQFMAALAKLASPVIDEIVRRMEPTSPVYPSRATRNRWRHYERWRRPLGRFIAISAARVSVGILNDCLATYDIGSTSLADRFFQQQARFQRTPWLFAAADDSRFSATLGNGTASVRLFNWYRPKVAACSHKLVSKRLTEITQFLRPISSLFAPQIVSHVAGDAIRSQIKRIGRRSSHSIDLMPPVAQ
jgi:hypothetical protein